MPKGFFTTLITITGVKVGTNEATLLKFNTLGFSSIPGYTRVQGEEIFNDGFLN